MRKVDPELQARLDGGATTLCRCWRVQRRDGVALGFTDHDNDLDFDGTRFIASSGLDASALQTGTGLSVDNGQVMGALQAAAVSDEDVRTGRYDGAEIEQWLVDWSRPDLRVLMFRGHFGEIRRMDGAFEVELRGLADALNRPVGRSLLKTCDRMLGDAGCGFALATPGFSVEAEVVAGFGDRLTLAVAGSFADGWFAGGTATWLDGANAGDRVAVRGDAAAGSGRAVELWHLPARTVVAGDRLRLVAGCDKRADTCRKKFGNFLNFRGFPHIPGEDWVTAYPKDGAVHDGSSLYGS